MDQADDVQHALMLRLLFYTGVRVSELCNILVADVDLEACKIRINEGKGDKDRYVLFGKSLRHGAADAHRRPPEESLALPDPAQHAGTRPGGSSRS